MSIIFTLYYSSIHPVTHSYSGLQQYKSGGSSKNVFKNLHKNLKCFHIFSYIQGIVMELLLQIAEVGCYSGVTLSAVIAWKLCRMEKLTWFNKMFLYYLILDVIFGNAETYLFFKLYRER